MELNANIIVIEQHATIRNTHMNSVCCCSNLCFVCLSVFFFSFLNFPLFQGIVSELMYTPHVTLFTISSIKRMKVMVFCIFVPFALNIFFSLLILYFWHSLYSSACHHYCSPLLFWGKKARFYTSVSCLKKNISLQFIV